MPPVACVSAQDTVPSSRVRRALPLNVVYSARYRHRHRAARLPHRQIRADRTTACSRRASFRPPTSSSRSRRRWDELALVHTPDYLAKLRDGTLSPEDVAQLELPWSRGDGRGLPPHDRRDDRGRHDCLRPRSTVERSSQTVLKSEFVHVCHIGGGLHHAFPNHGEGFCPFNDVAVAVRVLQARGVERVAIVDLDVHHGNGTAFIFESDPSRLHLLDAPAAQLPDVEAARLARHRAARRRARRRVSARARARAADGDGAARRSACSTSPAPIRTRTISSAG